MRFLTSGFFHESIVPGRWIHMLKYFVIVYILLTFWNNQRRDRNSPTPILNKMIGALHCKMYKEVLLQL